VIIDPPLVEVAGADAAAVVDADAWELRDDDAVRGVRWTTTFDFGTF
jgi:hypothetical protein